MAHQRLLSSSLIFVLNLMLRRCDWSLNGSSYLGCVEAQTLPTPLKKTWLQCGHILLGSFKAKHLSGSKKTCLTCWISARRKLNFLNREHLENDFAFCFMLCVCCHISLLLYIVCLFFPEKSYSWKKKSTYFKLGKEVRVFLRNTF